MSSPLGAIIILDGFGLRDEVKGNAVKQANKPNFDRLWETYPHSTLQASGQAVGLPKGRMGDSVVGPLNVGAGMIVYQSLTRINQAFEDGSLFNLDAFPLAIDQATENKKALYISALLSDGGV